MPAIVPRFPWRTPTFWPFDRKRPPHLAQALTQAFVRVGRFLPNTYHHWPVSSWTYLSLRFTIFASDMLTSFWFNTSEYYTTPYPPVNVSYVILGTKLC
jgi:hypothetical protein